MDRIKTYPDNQRSNEVPVHQKFPYSQFKIINLMCLWTFGRSYRKVTQKGTSQEGGPKWKT